MGKKKKKKNTLADPSTLTTKVNGTSHMFQ